MTADPHVVRTRCRNVTGWQLPAGAYLVALNWPGSSPVIVSKSSVYRPASTESTLAGISGPGSVRFQPVDADQSRRYCLSNECCGRTGASGAAGQERYE